MSRFLVGNRKKCNQAGVCAFVCYAVVTGQECGRRGGGVSPPVARRQRPRVLIDALMTTEQTVRNVCMWFWWVDGWMGRRFGVFGWEILNFARVRACVLLHIS